MKLRFIGIAILIVISVICFSYSIYLIWQRNIPVTKNNSSDVVLEVNSKTPTNISISSLNINLPIYPSVIENGKWQETKEGVSYLSTSPIPGEKGNAVFYGHNWPNLLGRLPKIKNEDIIQIKLSNGEHRNFKVIYTYTVTSDQTHILGQTEDARITIYTCTGFLDFKRFVVVAIPTN